MPADDVVGKLGLKVEVMFAVVLPIVGKFWSWSKATSNVFVVHIKTNSNYIIYKKFEASCKNMIKQPSSNNAEDS